MERIRIIAFFKRNFDLRQDKADEIETVESIRSGIQFKGANLWVLIFATFIEIGRAHV